MEPMLINKAGRRSKQWLIHGCAIVLLSGCATTTEQPVSSDPWEGMNRKVHHFNEGVDRAVLRPIALAYDGIVPAIVQKGIGNFFGNLQDVWIGANNFAQGKPGAGFNDWTRFLFNSSFGLAGFVDVASAMKMPKHSEDFGQTLAVWGVPDGPYLVLPFLGPSTLRDTVGIPFDRFGDLLVHYHNVPVRNLLMAQRAIHRRAALLGIDTALQQGTLDPYAYTRDYYLQQRRYKVYDGNPPLSYDDYNFDEMDVDAGADSAAGN